MEIMADRLPWCTSRCNTTIALPEASASLVWCKKDNHIIFNDTQPVNSSPGLSESKMRQTTFGCIFPVRFS
jgi:hypothetical protein